MLDPNPRRSPTSRSIPDLTRSTAALDLVRGFAIPLRAVRVIGQHKRLMLLSLVSALLTGAALITMAIVLWPISSQWAAELVQGDNWWLRSARFGLSVLVYVLALTFGALTVPNLLLAPLGDPTSEAAELACGDFTAPPLSFGPMLRGTVLSLSHTLLRVLLMTVGMLLLWPLHFVPLLGGVTWLVVSSLWSMFWLSVEHLSTPMARHDYPFSRVVGILRHRLALALGFGAALFLLLWVPILNFFLLPIAIVAGTLLYRGLLRIHGPSLVN